jgi:sugar lactone lactonase YvrE
MTSRFFVGLLLCSALTVLAQDGLADGTVRVIASFDPTQGQLPESVARARDGSLVVSMAPQHAIWRIIPDGAHPPVPLATLPVADGVNAVGVKIGASGDVFACTAGFDPTLDPSHVWRITPSGTVSDYAQLDPHGFPNDIAMDDSGSLFVTDTAFGAVYKIKSAGNVEIWLADSSLLGDPEGPLVGLPWGANGIAFDRSDRHLYISNTDYGAIFRVRVHGNGSAGPLALFVSDPRLRGADGIAFDRRGQLYVAVNAQNRIARIDRRGRVSIVAQGGPLDGPSALAFASDCPHRTSLYITSFALDTAMSGGMPLPSLDAITVPFGGLPMP